MPKMAIDAMHRINLGLDASIKNHLFAVPYFNDKTKKYDVDLRIGYEGKLYIRKQVAVTTPKDIILHLVFKNDRFVPLMQSADRKVESYEFDIINPFDRGELIGGFGYIVYDDPSLNKLVILSKADFDKYAKKAMSREFWDGWYEQMCYKTLAHRVAEKVEIDPKKANNSFHVVEEQDSRDMFADRDPDLKGLKEVSIDIEMPVAQAEVTADFSAQSKPVNDPAPGVKNPFED
jgi:recombination protein RecT